MKIVFLDVDGVINIDDENIRINNSNREFSRAVMVQLADIIEKTDAYIVLSSSWRFFESGSLERTVLTDNLRKYGLLDRLIGCTGSEIFNNRAPDDVFFGKGAGMLRSKAIFLWLMENWDNSNVESFVILDDLKNMGMMNRYLAICNPAEGITPLVKETAVEILSATVDKQGLFRKEQRN